MAYKNLGEAPSVSSMLLDNSIMVEIGGSIKRITLDKLIDNINEGGEMLLRQIAWGQEIQEWKTSTDWTSGQVGNRLLWQEFESMCGRYALKPDGRMAKLNPDNSSYFADGGTFSGTAISGDIHTMYYQPESYYLFKTDLITGKKYIWQSMYPIGGHKMPAICVGAYKGLINGSKLISSRGAKPTTSQTITQFWNAAQLTGSNFGIIDYNYRKAMIIKMLMKYGNTNIQAMLGYGICGSIAADLSSQITEVYTDGVGGDSYSSFLTTISGGTNNSRVNFGGVSDPYGWQWEILQGIYCGSSANPLQDGTEVFIYEGNRLPTAAELLDKPIGQYRKVSRLVVGNGNNIKSMLLGGYFDIIPSEYAGGSTSYWSDGEWSSPIGQTVKTGGSSEHGQLCGLSTSSITPTSAYFTAGSRLAYYGPITFVTGKELMASLPLEPDEL